jgi:hypothetical protein
MFIGGLIQEDSLCVKIWDSITPLLLQIEVSAHLLKLAEIAGDNFAKNGYYSQSLGSFRNENEQSVMSKKNLDKMRRTASANM